MLSIANHSNLTGELPLEATRLLTCFVEQLPINARQVLVNIDTMRSDRRADAGGVDAATHPRSLQQLLSSGAAHQPNHQGARPRRCRGPFTSLL
ncbi:unnamed protein product, partial [Iphiclides podalirius]